MIYGNLQNTEGLSFIGLIAIILIIGKINLSIQFDNLSERVKIVLLQHEFGLFADAHPRLF